MQPEEITVSTDSVTVTANSSSTVHNTDSDTVVTVPDTATITTDSGQEYSVAEIEHSNRIYKSATPKQTVDWYIKWCSSIIVLFAITLRSTGIAEFQIYDMFLSWLGAVGWWVVGWMWKDRALILLNGVISVVLFGGLVKWVYYNGLPF